MLVQLAWSALGSCLLPSAGASVAAGAMDPLDMLLGSGGFLGSCVALLATCAVATTVIGTNLALRNLLAGAGTKRKIEYTYK